MTAKRSNGAHEASDTVFPFAALMQLPTANSFLVSQRIALEAARFWARRMHAYADQMETIASCASPDEFANAQTRFLERMRDDYAAESEAIGAMLTPERAARRSSKGDGGEAAN
jgi:hypothetical protein